MVRIENRILSPTAVNTYLACPRKFYLRYIKKFRTRPSIYLIRGQMVHRTLHQFYQHHPRISPEMPLQKIRRDLFSLFNEQWKKAQDSLDALGLEEKQIEFFYDDSHMMLLNFSHWFYKNDMPSPELAEARIFSKNLRLMGIIDAVLLLEDKVILVDYKTSKHAKITEDIKRQAALYALLFEDKFKVVPDAVWIHFLKAPDDPQPLHVDDALLEYGKILLESIREKTVSLDEVDYPCTCGGYCEKEFTARQ